MAFHCTLIVKNIRIHNRCQTADAWKGSTLHEGDQSAWLAIGPKHDDSAEIEGQSTGFAATNLPLSGVLFAHEPSVYILQSRSLFRG